MGNTYTANSVCGMCSARCPIQVEVKDGKIQWICGHPDSSLKGALCAKGVAGVALEDSARPTAPMIRTGPRGSGQWKTVSWDEALDYVADSLKKSQAAHGPESLLWSDRAGPFTDIFRALMHGLGSPNVCTHSVSCDLNGHHAGQAVVGLGRPSLVNDYANCKHLVLQARNIFEALTVAEARSVGKALKNGCRLSVIDIRTSITSAKAQDFICLRPGTDYALNLAVIHTIINEGLYQKDFVAKHCLGFEELAEFVKPYSAAWAAEETSVPATAILSLARELAKAAPHVIWHPGWMTSRYSDSFLVAQSAFAITALLGGIGAKGGIIPASTAKDVGREPLQKFTTLYPASKHPRVDGIGTSIKGFDPSNGLLHKAIEAMKTGLPYPIKSYIAWRHDTIQSMPDPQAMKDCLNNLDLLVSVTFSWSDTAWHSDVVLPLSMYFNRESIIASKSGLQPQFFVRQRVMPPKDDTRADWEIISGIASRMGLDKLVFSSAQEVWDYQLQGTGLSMDDFAKSGTVSLSKGPAYKDMNEFKFPTPSGKIELNGAGWEAATKLPFLAPYKSPAKPPADGFRVIFGRTAVHTQGHTMDNPLLAEQMPENVAWIHPSRAKALGLGPDERVELLNVHGESSGALNVFITDGIHPEALFMVHGFGHKLPPEKTAYGKGAADNSLLSGGLSVEDPRGGGLSMQEHFIRLRKVEAQ